MGFLSAGGKRQREVRFREELEKGRKRTGRGGEGHRRGVKRLGRRRLVISWGAGLEDRLWDRSPGARDGGVRSIRCRARERGKGRRRGDLLLLLPAKASSG